MESSILARRFSILLAILIVIFSPFFHRAIVGVISIVLAFSIISLYFGWRKPIVAASVFFFFAAFVDPLFVSKIFLLVYFFIFLFFSLKLYGLGQVFAYFTGIMAYTLIVSHVTGLLPAPSLRVPFFEGVLHLITAVAILSVCPDEGVIAPLHSKYVGGQVARIMIPFLVVVLGVTGPIILLLRDWFPFSSGVFLLAVAFAFSIFIMTVGVHRLNILAQRKSELHREIIEAWKFFGDVVENIEEAIAVFDKNGGKVYENRQMKKIKPQVQDYWLKLKEEQRPVPIKELKVNKGYFTGWITPLYREGRFDGAIVSLTEITDLIRVRQELESSMNEKEALLREIHHRVKNNLQVIISLLNLQASKADKKTRKVFLSAQNRIKTMAMIHDAIYEEGMEVDMQTYVERLVHNLKGRYKLYNTNFKINCKVKFNLETAMPLAHLLNELLTRFIKNVPPTKLGIEVKEYNGGYQLIISSNRAPTTGGGRYPFVRALIQQLDGKLQTKNNGAKVIIKFKELKYKRRI